MKKLFKLSISLFLIILSMLSITACGQTKKIETKDVLGDWKAFYDFDGNEYISDIYLYSDGTYKEMYYKNNFLELDSVRKGNFKFNDNVLTLYNANSSSVYKKLTYKIGKLYYSTEMYDCVYSRYYTV